VSIRISTYFSKILSDGPGPEMRASAFRNYLGDRLLRPARGHETQYPPDDMSKESSTESLNRMDFIVATRVADPPFRAVTLPAREQTYLRLWEPGVFDKLGLKFLLPRVTLLPNRYGGSTFARVDGVAAAGNGTSGSGRTAPWGAAFGSPACRHVGSSVCSPSGRYRRAVCPWAGRRRSRISGPWASPADRADRSPGSSAVIQSVAGQRYPARSPAAGCSRPAGVRWAWARYWPGLAVGVAETSDRTCPAGRPGVGCSVGIGITSTHTSLCTPYKKD
jgi:hypothetical protein